MDSKDKNQVLQRGNDCNEVPKKRKAEGTKKKTPSKLEEQFNDLALMLSELKIEGISGGQSDEQ